MLAQLMAHYTRTLHLLSVTTRLGQLVYFLERVFPTPHVYLRLRQFMEPIEGATFLEGRQSIRISLKFALLRLSLKGPNIATESA